MSEVTESTDTVQPPTPTPWDPGREGFWQKVTGGPRTITKEWKSKKLDHDARIDEDKEVDAALGSMQVERIALDAYDKKVFVLRGKIDTRKEDEKKDTDPAVVLITGAWGLSHEDRGNLEAMIRAFGKAGICCHALSLPGHGDSSPIHGEGREQWDLTYVQEVVAAYIRQEVKVDEKGNAYKKRPVIAMGYSTGGTVCMMVAALFPGLIDALALVEPVADSYRGKLLELAVRFGLDPLLAALGLDKPDESPPSTIPDPGAKVIIDRIRGQKTRGGIPLSVVVNSARAVAKVNLLEDDTLKKLGELDIPILIVTGDRPLVVPGNQFGMLESKLRAIRASSAEGEGKPDNITREIIEDAGHAVPFQKTKILAGRLEKWLKANNFIPTIKVKTSV